MNTIEVVKLVCELLDIKEGDEDLPTDQNTIDLMMVALNNVISEIAEEYIPFLYSETVDCDGQTIAYSTLSRPVREIIKVKHGKKKLGFCTFSEGVRLGEGICGKVEVVYSYIPQRVNWMEDITLPPEISLRTLAYGVAGEFALISARYEECVNYDTRFINAINSARRKKREKRLPLRGWY